MHPKVSTSISRPDLRRELATAPVPWLIEYTAHILPTLPPPPPPPAWLQAYLDPVAVFGQAKSSWRHSWRQMMCPHECRARGIALLAVWHPLAILCVQLV